MPDRDFEIECKKCEQTYKFTVRRSGVEEVTDTDAAIALQNPGRTDPNDGAIVLGNNAVKNQCSKNTPFQHIFTKRPHAVEE
jgi:hypothetical protein